MFKKPGSLVLDSFFEFHPHQPDIQKPFVSKKIFLKKIKHNVSGFHIIGKHFFVLYVWLLVMKIILLCQECQHGRMFINALMNMMIHNKSTEAYFLNHNKKI